jgi:peptidoglycan/xylan/chitin deacetylase (PgdA/CDA1 family)
MYHQISKPNNKNSLANFYNHLNYLSYNFPIVLPGEQLKKNCLSVCLTFDDAYYDFYHYVYPQLQSLNIKAALGIPTNYIAQTSIVPANIRLGVEYPAGLSNDHSLQTKMSPLCTWQEIREMVNSGLVMPCSHSLTHANLKTCTLEQLELETKYSKQMLEENVKTKITSFIYPFGAMNATTHRVVRKYYAFGLRIGTAINSNWQQNDGLLYRVDADEFLDLNSKITSSQLLHWRLKYYINKLRGK